MMNMIDVEQRDRTEEVGTMMITIGAEGITEMNRHIVTTIGSVVVTIRQIADRIVLF